MYQRRYVSLLTSGRGEADPHVRSSIRLHGMSVKSPRKDEGQWWKLSGKSRARRLCGSCWQR